MPQIVFRGPSSVALGAVAASLLVIPRSVYALQTHGAPEGLFAHQGAHLFLIVSLVIFLVNIRRSSLDEQKSWRLLFRGTLLLALWNLWAFFGHQAEVYMPESSVVLLPGRHIPSVLVASWREAAFYVFKMDHLICLPALLFFYGGLRRIRTALTENGAHRKEGRP